MAVAAIFLLLWATLTVAEGTPIGAFLQRVMVELPAAILERVTRGHILLALVMIVLVGLAVCFGEGDGVRMLSMAAPDIAAWLTTFEISAYLDVAASLVAVASAMRVKNVRDRVVTALALPSRRPAQGETRPRCSRRRAQIVPANDDEDGAPLALAS